MNNLRKVALTLAVFCGACASDGVERGPAPYGAMTSSDKALTVVFDEVCVPTVLDGGDFETLAKSRYMVEVKSARDATGQSSRVFGLASFGDVTATLWEDGTCMVALERGDSPELEAHLFATLAARGETLTKGLSKPAADEGVNTLYCNADPRPLMLGIIVPATERSRRSKLVANLRRAVGGASDICARTVPNRPPADPAPQT